MLRRIETPGREAGRMIPRAGLEGGLALLAGVALFLSLTQPVTDPDFWWHLAAGRWQWQQGALMRVDPFLPAPFAAEAARAQPHATTQYWLSQLIFLGVHAAGGPGGILLLRAGLFTLLWALLFRMMRRSGCGLPSTIALTWLSVQAVARDLGYVADRPQMWSSLLFVVLVFVLERARAGARWSHAALPPLMLVWGNLHGGFLLGDLVIVVYLAARLLGGRAGRSFVLSCALALAASACNPNGLAIAVSYLPARFFGASQLLVSAEERPLLGHGGLAGIARLMPHLTALALAGVAALPPASRRLARRRPERLALALLLIALGLLGIRFLVFFLTVGTWLTAVNLRGIAARARALRRLRRRLPAQAPRFVVPALTAMMALAAAAGWARQASETSALRPSSAARHPYEGAADFLVRRGARGTIFNEYEAGGYLAWRLFPSCRVFVHGCAPAPTALSLFRSTVDQPTRPVAPAPASGYRFVYQQVLRDHGIDFVVLPGADPTSGTLIQLAVSLAQDPEWAVVWADERALVFERLSPANAGLLLRTMLPQTAVYDNVIGIARRAAQTAHARSFPGWRYALAYAHYRKGERAQALAYLEDYLRLRPEDAASAGMRDRIARELRDRGQLGP